MAGDKLPTGPSEGINGTEQMHDSVTGSKRADITENFQDIHRIKFHAEKIERSCLLDLDEAVEILFQKKAEGKNCFIEFNGTKIYSVDTNNIDDAYIQVTGMTKREFDEKREKMLKKVLPLTPEQLQEVKITKENVVSGLKFIVEHKDMKQDQLIDELIKLGCDFTSDDIKKQFPVIVNFNQGIKRGDLQSGAAVIWNIMDNEELRRYFMDRFFSHDEDDSIYAFIRKITGDETYTKEYVDSLVKKEK